MVKQRKKTKKTARTRKVWKWAVWILSGLVLASVIVGVVIWWNVEGSKTELEKRGLPNRGVPVMEISLNGVSLEEIDGGGKDIKYEGNEVDLYDEGMVYKYDDVEVKGRGNLTWSQPKKSYQIKFAENVDLLGLGKAKKWVLLANYLDPTLMRNDIALTLSEMVGMEYNLKGEFIELYVDGDYRGVYYITQKIKISKNVVNLRNEDGVLVEIDGLHREDDDDFYKTYLGDTLVLKDAIVEDEDFREKIFSNFMLDFNRAEKAVKDKDYEEAEKLLDMDSFAKFFLVNEFAVDPDAYSSSYYLYRGNDGKIKAGPVWDFDLAFANRIWGESKNENFYSPRESMARRDEVFNDDGVFGNMAVSKLIYYLIEMPEFRKEISRVFQEKMMGRKQELIQKMMMRIEKIYWAVEADEEKWERENFEEELIRLLDWIRIRYEYFGEIYGDGYNLVENI